MGIASPHRVAEFASESLESLMISSGRFWSSR